jgi:hypothetical protein
MIAVKNYAVKEAIPYRSLLLDSWWSVRATHILCHTLSTSHLV